MAEPVLDGAPQTNTYGEHEYKIRIAFGASTASTWRAKDVTVARSSATVFTVTLPKPYAEITTLSQSWKKATGADPVSAQITTDALTTTGVLTFTTVSTNSAGTATAPANGDVLYLTLGVSCDHLNDSFTGTTA